jgi:ArsR family transcriptional regulator
VPQQQPASPSARASADREAVFATQAELHKALADKTRLHILALLRVRDLCVCELVEALSATQPNVSQHLRRLRSIGLIRERREGQWVFYGMADEVRREHAHVLSVLPDLTADVQTLTARGGCTQTGEARRT